jgi:hypothetical protein
VENSAPRPVVWWQVGLLAVLTFACLAPFLNKAVHIDDPLFIWTARQIQAHPLDFYGFNVNWIAEVWPMSSVTQNPPLASYYMAVVAWLLGWSETALHAGFLVPALAAIIGVYFLAREFCAHPFLAGLAALATPAFLVSSTTLMCDTLMLSAWIWAVFLWMRGLAEPHQGKLLLAALLIAACALTKYFGLSLIPLLAVHTIMTRRRDCWPLLWLALPVAVLLAYQAWARHLYGGNLLFNAVSYATAYRVGGGLLAKFPTGLAFLGGCVLVAPAALLWLWGKRGVMAASGAVAILILLLAARKTAAGFSLVDNGRLNWLFLVQWAAFVTGGAMLLILAAADAARRRDAKATLLLLWVFGTFFFTCFCNWTVAARNILPLVPAAAFLLVRRLEAQNSAAAPRLFYIPLALSLTVGLLVSWADFKLADSARTAAQTVYEHVVWHFKNITFEGHWGFQYYMEKLGGVAIDKRNMRLAPDTAVIVPTGNSVIFLPPPEHAALWNEFDITYPLWLCTMSVDDGAGYYSDGWGPAPYIICRPPKDRYLIYSGK